MRYDGRSKDMRASRLQEQRDNARAKLATKDAEIARLRDALEGVAHDLSIPNSSSEFNLTGIYLEVLKVLESGQ